MKKILSLKLKDVLNGNFFASTFTTEIFFQTSCLTALRVIGSTVGYNSATRMTKIAKMKYILEIKYKKYTVRVEGKIE